MRSVPSDIASKLAIQKQTRANSADPSASIWIGRPTTPLTTDVFLERQAVLTDTSITDVSVAVCHPRQGAANTKINMAYISGGVAHVVTALEKTKMQANTWIDSGFAENASAISVAYDGTMPKDDRGNVEFVTESQPLVFWVNAGKLYARKLGTISEENEVITTTYQKVTITVVSASSYYGAGYEAANAIDNNPDTRWASANKTATQYLQVDLATNINVGKIRVMTKSGYTPLVLEIHASLDNITFSKIADITATQDKTFSEVTFTSMLARYIKVVMISTPNASFYNINELEVYEVVESSETVNGVILAEANCTDVSAVRAMWSEVGDFDFGLVAFFILSGSIYYRQLISGEWTNAQLVSFGPESVTWVAISASRTWDYRVALQVKSSAGVVYELFTQFMGIGKQNVEHINVANISAESETTEITYHNTKETENIEVSDISGVAPYGGLYSTAIPEIVSAYNIDDGTGNWGIYAIFIFNSQMVAEEVTAQASAFQIVDTNSIAYGASSASIGSDGLTVTLAFLDFNNARGVCTARYVPGTVKSMHGDSVLATSLSFTPQNLVPSEVPLPEVEDVWNE